MEFIEQFTAARKVSTPLVCVRTFDPRSTVKAITRSLGDEAPKTPILIWDAINGLLPINATPASSDAHAFTLSAKGQEQPEDYGQEETRNLHTVLQVLAIRPKEDMIVFVSNAHMQWMSHDPNVIQGIWNLRDIFKGRAVMLVLLTTAGAVLPPELVNDVILLDEPLPTAAQLDGIVSNIFKGAKAETSLTSELKKKAVDALIGIPAFPAEQAAAMSLSIQKDSGGVVTGAVMDVPQLWTRKRQQINNAPGLAMYSGKEKLADVGGVEGVKEFMSAVMTGRKAPSIILWYDEIEKGYAGHGTDSSGTKTEMLGSQLTWHQEKEIIGALYFGVPGVSKSLLIKAIGNEFDVPVIGFDVAAMQAGHVGESNANLRLSQQVVEATAGGGTILALATSNNLSALPVELLSRFGLATFFFDLPSTKEERDAIWAIHRTRLGLTGSEPNPESEGWNGRDIVGCCEKAWMLNWSLAKAANVVVPISKSDGKRIQNIRAEAHNRYLSAATGQTYTMNETVTTRPGISGPVFNDGDTARKFQ